ATSLPRALRARVIPQPTRCRGGALKSSQRPPLGVVSENAVLGSLTTQSINPVTYPGAVISGGRDWLADFLNRRRDNGCAVGGVMKLQLHTATDEAQLDHGTTPGRARDGYLDWLRTELRMS